jgi:hypothetical protein
MRVVCEGERVSGMVRRYVASFGDGGGPDKELHLRDLLVAVERVLVSDRERPHAATWQRLRRAILGELTTL